jgi:hypothetical protein
MNLPFAPPPGLPLPLLDPEAHQQLLHQFELKNHLDILPLLALTTLFFWGLFKLWEKYRPVAKQKKSWREELFDPLLDESTSPLTSTELIEKLFYKDPSLAEEVEPLLHEIDTTQFSPHPSPLHSIIQKLKKRVSESKTESIGVKNNSRE